MKIDIREYVKRMFNSTEVLEIEMSSPVVYIPAYCSRPAEQFRCKQCGDVGTLTSPVGWVCKCNGEPELEPTGKVEWA
jgi:hypothetical protein